MTYEISMAEDGILKISISGELDHHEMKAFLKDIALYLEAATETNPVNLLARVDQAARISTEARHLFMEFNRDNRLGYLAYVGDNRAFRVITRFMQKAAQRENIQSFGREEEALAWLHGVHALNNHNVQARSLS